MNNNTPSRIARKEYENHRHLVKELTCNYEYKRAVLYGLEYNKNEL